MKKYEAVIDYLDKCLLGGAEKLPSEGELCAALNISRYPVRHAIEIMEKQGRIFTRPGVGTFAAGKRPSPPVKTASGQQHFVGLVLGNFLNSNAPLLLGVQEALFRRGYLLNTIYNADGGADSLHNLLLRTVDGGMMEGLLCIPPTELSAAQQPFLETVRTFQEKTVRPVVVLERKLQGYGGSQVVIDNAAGSALAVEHFLAGGRRKIAYLGKTDYQVGLARYQGYCRGLLENGISPDPSLIANDENSGSNFEYMLAHFITAALDRILAAHPDCRTFVTFSYSVAYQAYLYLKTRGLLTEEHRFAGYDVDSGLEADFYRRYLIIERPLRALGESAVEVLLELSATGNSEGVISRREYPVLRSCDTIGSLRMNA